MEQIVETEFHIQPTEEEMVSLESEEKNENLDQNTLLIVEDNQDLRLFLSDSLKKEYHIFLQLTDYMHYLFSRKSILIWSLRIL